MSPTLIRYQRYCKYEYISTLNDTFSQKREKKMCCKYCGFNRGAKKRKEC